MNTQLEQGSAIQHSPPIIIDRNPANTATNPVDPPKSKCLDIRMSLAMHGNPWSKIAFDKWWVPAKSSWNTVAVSGGPSEALMAVNTTARCDSFMAYLMHTHSVYMYIHAVWAATNCKFQSYPHESKSQAACRKTQYLHYIHVDKKGPFDVYKHSYDESTPRLLVRETKCTEIWSLNWKHSRYLKIDQKETNLTLHAHVRTFAFATAAASFAQIMPIDLTLAFCVNSAFGLRRSAASVLEIGGRSGSWQHTLRQTNCIQWLRHFQTPCLFWWRGQSIFCCGQLKWYLPKLDVGNV